MRSMTPPTLSVLLIPSRLIASIFVAMAAVWAGLALCYRLPGGRAVKLPCVVAWTAFCLATVIALWLGVGAVALPAFGLVFAMLLLWWIRVRPSNAHDWSDDVAQIAHGTVDGNRVTLHNVRNFDWRTTADYTQRWETRDYDLDRLTTVDMIMSYWAGPAIAHMLISFGFDRGSQDEGSHVVFSVEIRRERSQAFSEIGGFFKEFELSIIAADERDVVRLRTNVRGEEVYLYRLQLPRPAIRSLFLAYIGEANRLVDSPRFYNTITVNCTTMVYHMMRRIVGRLPFSYRLLFSGYLPEYVYRVGGLDRRFTLTELRDRGRIAERAKQADCSTSFSADIRRGLPGDDIAADIVADVAK